MFDPKIQVYIWSDYTIVLSSIHHQENWVTFAGNRFKEILNHTPSEEWHFVVVVIYPADFPSRGCTPNVYKKPIGGRVQVGYIKNLNFGLKFNKNGMKWKSLKRRQIYHHSS